MLDRPEGKGRGWYHSQSKRVQPVIPPPLCDFHTTEYRSRVRIKARICLSRLGGELYAPRTRRETQGTPQGWWGGARVLVTFTPKSSPAKGAWTPIKKTSRSDTIITSSYIKTGTKKGSSSRIILFFNLVGRTGFEPATTCPPDKHATRLRHRPKTERAY